LSAKWRAAGISSLEGTKKKIKLLQRQAYGYRNLEFFQLKLLAIHRS